MKAKTRVAVFASGNGTNAEEIFKYFKSHDTIEVGLLLSNKADAYVLERAKKAGISKHVFNRVDFKDPDGVLNLLQENQIDFIVLAGFLWLMPPHIVEAYPDRIINIHPALLPKHGGKGMYGTAVHQAVKSAGDKETGITIHFVNERYDEGAIIFQAKCNVEPQDDPNGIAQKVHQLEYRHYPQVIEATIRKTNQN
ncbi:MAG: phosphoribosylglycinamide formyltransferase [Bacteroidota bacterium]